MVIATERICPQCRAFTPSSASACTQCGQDLKYGSYKIIFDGKQWAIAYKGEIAVDDLTLDHALSIADIMNYYGNL